MPACRLGQRQLALQHRQDDLDLLVHLHRHCDGGTGSTVMLDVQDIFRNIYHYCVGPGMTNLQPVVRLRVIDAWWNGGYGCQPGYYGPA